MKGCEIERGLLKRRGVCAHECPCFMNLDHERQAAGCVAVRCDVVSDVVTLEAAEAELIVALCECLQPESSTRIYDTRASAISAPQFPGRCIHPPAWANAFRGVHDQLVVMAAHPMQYATQTSPELCLPTCAILLLCPEDRRDVQMTVCSHSESSASSAPAERQWRHLLLGMDLFYWFSVFQIVVIFIASLHTNWFPEKNRTPPD